MKKHLFVIGEFYGPLAVVLVEEDFWESENYIDTSEQTLTSEELNKLGLLKDDNFYKAIPGIDEDELRRRLLAEGFEENEDVEDYVLEEMAESHSDWMFDEDTEEWINPEDDES